MRNEQLISVWRTRATRARTKARDITRSEDPDEIEDLISPDQHWHSLAAQIDQCADELEQQK